MGGAAKVVGEHAAKEVFEEATSDGGETVTNIVGSVVGAVADLLS